MNFTVPRELLRAILDPRSTPEERRDALLTVIGEAWSDGFESGVETYKRAIVNAAPMSKPEARA